jgi:flagellar assembly protein FliH
MNNARPHRFPPLSQLVARPSAAAPGDASPVADGFQQGLDRGYEEGLEAGRQAGHAQGLEAGRAEGMRLGHAEGHAEVVAQYAHVAQPLEAAVAALKNLQADYQAAMRKEVVELVAKVARQVIRGELALQPLQLLNMVDETLATLPRVRDEEVEIYLNPEELQRIEELDAERARRWKLLPDARLEPGECHVKAGHHEADAGCRQRQAAVMDQISTQLLDPASEVQP